MKKKILATACVLAILISVGTTFSLNYGSKNGGSETYYSSIDEANKAADFNLEHSDRISGTQATGYKANSSSIEVSFGNSGLIRKTLGVIDNSGGDNGFKDISTREINGMKVTFKGRDKKVYIASWNYNNFAYTISLNKDGQGADPDEMIEYIEATK